MKSSSHVTHVTDWETEVQRKNDSQEVTEQVGEKAGTRPQQSDSQPALFTHYHLLLFS